VFFCFNLSFCVFFLLIYFFFLILFLFNLPPLLLIFLTFFKKRSISFEFFCPQIYFSEVSIAFQLDWLSLIFFFTISTISAIVFIYTKFYIRIKLLENSNNNRFILVLFSFILSMFILVFSNSWVTLLIGWDGLGLSSFLLVVYYNNHKRLEGGLLTFLTNRMGDAFFIVTFLNINISGSFNIEFIVTKNTVFFNISIYWGYHKKCSIPLFFLTPCCNSCPNTCFLPCTLFYISDCWCFYSNSL